MAEYSLTDERILAVLASLSVPYDGTAPVDLLAEPRAIARAAQAKLVRWLERETRKQWVVYDDPYAGRYDRIIDGYLWWELCRELGIGNG